MLVLTRKRDECVAIGDDVVVTIVRIGSESVRIGITAPRDVNIVREELLGSQIGDEIIEGLREIVEGNEDE